MSEVIKTGAVIWFLYYSTVLCQEALIIQTFSESIGNTVMECQDEIQFGYDIIQEFLSFWDPKYSLRSKGLGCVVLCVNSKLELFDNNGTTRVENVQAFGKAIGSDINTTSRIISLYELCKSIVKPMANECETLFEITKCFRYGIFQLHWAPGNPAIQ